MKMLSGLLTITTILFYIKYRWQDFAEGTELPTVVLMLLAIASAGAFALVERGILPLAVIGLQIAAVVTTIAWDRVLTRRARQDDRRHPYGGRLSKLSSRLLAGAALIAGIYFIIVTFAIFMRKDTPPWELYIVGIPPLMMYCGLIFVYRSSSRRQRPGNSESR
ncbi:MAG: hypothetical protein H0U53_05880 [Actinobacteria bacterium]|nr:hypothetical protein [Actinomycetota bacterium]